MNLSHTSLSLYTQQRPPIIPLSNTKTMSHNNYTKMDSPVHKPDPVVDPETRKPDPEPEPEPEPVLEVKPKLSRNRSVSASAQTKTATTTPLSMRRSSSVSERYCRIYDQSSATWPLPEEAEDEEDGQENVKKIKKNGNNVKKKAFLKACKRFFGIS